MYCYILYVDDVLIFGNDLKFMKSIEKRFFSSNFDIKDMGEADVILEIEIHRHSKGII